MKQLLLPFEPTPQRDPGTM